MEDASGIIGELVIANRILAREGVVDAFGHISVRNPNNPESYFISISRAPELITMDDIVEAYVNEDLPPEEWDLQKLVSKVQEFIYLCW